ncbi:precorrin-6A reductase [Alkalibacter mobilis]|uniref:precorrin-6A reductase n=1 Tax=Alkalibacter mobilis TaxID=2787712 RepID=UPI00189E38BA|nr:precorrin-6A reductase [Alkalibacter mobilis]MBF7097178.1 precorrin-6A reductase [Alkalibacter mobilis]
MIAVFAGTKEGRDYVYSRLSKGESILVSVATDYGAALYEKLDGLTVICGRMNSEEIKRVLIGNKIKEVVDATHPYAEEITKNIKFCCDELSIKYKLLERKAVLESFGQDELLRFDSYRNIAQYLSDKTGNIMLTIGSNNIDYFNQSGMIERTFIRVLPTSDVIKKCESLGFKANQIIGMQGPFSQQMNESMFLDFGIKYLVTKDSGVTGGTLEKVRPALKLGLEVLVFSRPEKIRKGI